jgi:hypothetical protein
MVKVLSALIVLSNIILWVSMYALWAEGYFRNEGIWFLVAFISFFSGLIVYLAHEEDRMAKESWRENLWKYHPSQYAQYRDYLGK